MPFPAFSSPAVYRCRVFQSRVFRPCIFDRPACFRSRIFSPPCVPVRAIILSAFIYCHVAAQTRKCLVLAESQKSGLRLRVCKFHVSMWRRMFTITKFSFLLTDRTRGYSIRVMRYWRACRKAVSVQWCLGFVSTEIVK